MSYLGNGKAVPPLQDLRSRGSSSIFAALLSNIQPTGEFWVLFLFFLKAYIRITAFLLLVLSLTWMTEINSRLHFPNSTPALPVSTQWPKSPLYSVFTKSQLPGVLLMTHLFWGTSTVQQSKSKCTSLKQPQFPGGFPHAHQEIRQGSS